MLKSQELQAEENEVEREEQDTYNVLLRAGNNEAGNSSDTSSPGTSGCALQTARYKIGTQCVRGFCSLEEELIRTLLLSTYITCRNGSYILNIYFEELGMAD